MLKQHLRLHSPAVWLVALLVAGLTLAACGGAAEQADEVPATAETETTAETATQVEATETEAPEVEAEEAAESEETEAGDEALVAEATEEIAEEETLPAQAAPTTCQGISIPDNTLIAAVSADEWSKGPADAPVTLIEYGDFQ